MELFISLLLIYVLYAYFKNKKEKEKEYISPTIQITISDNTYYSEAYTPPKSKNKSKGRWIQPGEEISINKKTITNGLFYYGGVLKSSRYNDVDSSLVDDTIPIKEAHYTFSDNSLGYWPWLNTLSPKCRGAYIDWLASDRDMPNVPIGYLFIYFYGIERRIIKDRKDGLVDNTELGALCTEIERLRTIFHDNRSFSNYSSSLLDYVANTSPDVYSIPDDEIKNSVYSDAFKVRLARIVSEGKPLPAELAYAWISNHPDYSLRTPSRRCPDEFKALFIEKYKDKYQDGMIIKPNKTKLRLHYRPASSSLEYFEYGPDGLCDPSVLTGPTNKLVDIGLECSDELDAYSRYLGKKDTTKEDLEAVALLPNSLIANKGIGLIEDLKTWGKNIVQNNEGLTDVKEFWNLTNMPTPAKINKKEQELICNLISKSGFSLAPHPVLHGCKLNIDDKIVLYEASTGNPVENTPIFDDVAIKLRLGAIIANADMKIHTSEVSYLRDMVHSNDNLTITEKQSLDAYLKWLLNSPSNFNGLKAALNKLRDSDKEIVRKMLISVALADGKVDPNEVKEIEKLYTALGLDKANVPADIHALSSGKPTRTSQKATKSSTAGGFTLDSNILELHESETKAAQNILNKIFVDEGDDEPEEDKALQSLDSEPNLENKALLIYKEISDKETINREEFEKICSKYGFFVDAAIDSINEWSFDNVDAPVVEEDAGNIVIDREIADELQEIES